MSAAELKDFVKQSSLSDDKKQFWDAVFAVMSDDETLIAARFVNGEHRNLFFYTDTLKRKYEAFLHQDEEKFNSVIADEKQYLKSI